MTNGYMPPEVIEIGAANEVILGAKLELDVDDNGEATMPDSNLDE
jgi:hypothetical protein